VTCASLGVVGDALAQTIDKKAKASAAAAAAAASSGGKKNKGGSAAAAVAPSAGYDFARTVGLALSTTFFCSPNTVQLMTASMVHVTASMVRVTNLTPGSECAPTRGLGSARTTLSSTDRYNTSGTPRSR
jgi:hypothetical protein